MKKRPKKAEAETEAAIAKVLSEGMSRRQVQQYAARFKNPGGAKAAGPDAAGAVAEGSEGEGSGGRQGRAFRHDAKHLVVDKVRLAKLPEAERARVRAELLAAIDKLFSVKVA